MRKQYTPMKTSIDTLFFWYFNNPGSVVSTSEFDEIIKHSSFKYSLHNRMTVVERLLTRGLIWIENDVVRPTDEGAWQSEKRHHTIQSVVYGLVLLRHNASRGSLKNFYLILLQRITGKECKDRTWILLAALKRDGLVDYTPDRVWVTRQMKGGENNAEKPRSS